MKYLASKSHHILPLQISIYFLSLEVDLYNDVKDWGLVYNKNFGLIQFGFIFQYQTDYEFEPDSFTRGPARFTYAGKVQLFTCKLHINCQYVIKRLQPSNASEDQFSHNGQEHAEEANPVSDYQKNYQRAEAMYLEGFQTVLTMNIEFRERKEAEIEKTQLGNMLKKIRAKHEASPIVSVGDMKKFCDQYWYSNSSQDEPDLNKAFVYRKYFGEEYDFRVFFLPKGF